MIEAKPFRLEVAFDNAQAVTPGQGQTVQVSGVEIGQIGRVRLEDGVAVVQLDLQRRYRGLVRTDARAALRARTGLKDMYIQVFPGSQDAPVAREGFRIPLGATRTDVDLDEVLQALDGDTRDYLRLLVRGAGAGLRGRGPDLAEAFRRFGHHRTRPGTRQPRRRARAGGAAHRGVVAEPAVGRAGGARRRPGAAGRCLGRHLPGRSPPRTATSRARSRCCPARCARRAPR